MHTRSNGTASLTFTIDSSRHISRKWWEIRWNCIKIIDLGWHWKSLTTSTVRYSSDSLACFVLIKNFTSELYVL